MRYTWVKLFYIKLQELKLQKVKKSVSYAELFKKPSKNENSKPLVDKKAQKESTESETESRVPKKPVFPCNNCNALFMNINDLSNHEDIHVEEVLKLSANVKTVISFSCNLCKAFFKSENDLRKHMDYVHKDKKENLKLEIVCPKCNAFFKKKDDLVTHHKKGSRKETSLPNCEKRGII